MRSSGDAAAFSIAQQHSLASSPVYGSHQAFNSKHSRDRYLLTFFYILFCSCSSNSAPIRCGLMLSPVGLGKCRCVSQIGSTLAGFIDGVCLLCYFANTFRSSDKWRLRKRTALFSTLLAIHSVNTSNTRHACSSAAAGDRPRGSHGKGDEPSTEALGRQREEPQKTSVAHVFNVHQIVAASGAAASIFIAHCDGSCAKRYPVVCL